MSIGIYIEVDFNKLAVLLRTLRKEQSQTEFGAPYGLTQSQISELENGRMKRLPSDTAEKIERLLGHPLPKFATAEPNLGQTGVVELDRLLMYTHVALYELFIRADVGSRRILQEQLEQMVALYARMMKVRLGLMAPQSPPNSHQNTG